MVHRVRLQYPMDPNHRRLALIHPLLPLPLRPPFQQHLHTQLCPHVELTVHRVIIPALPLARLAAMSLLVLRYNLKAVDPPVKLKMDMLVPLVCGILEQHHHLAPQEHGLLPLCVLRP